MLSKALGAVEMLRPKVTKVSAKRYLSLNKLLPLLEKANLPASA